MAAYGTDGRCLMRVLQEELDDPEPRDCGRCSVCTGPRFAQPPAAELVELAQRHLRSRPLELEVKKMAPDAEGAMRKIPENARTEPGWALARLGDGGWWPAVERGLRAGRFDDEIAVALADILRDAGTPAAWVTSVPSARLGDVCTRLAERLAGELGVEHLALIARTEDRPPQREMANAVQQAANVRGRLHRSPRLLRPAPASCSTTSASRAGRSRWSAASCGEPVRRRWSRSCSRRCPREQLPASEVRGTVVRPWESTGPKKWQSELMSTGLWCRRNMRTAPPPRHG